MTPKRRKLSDILGGRKEDIRAAWDHTEVAGEFAPLPSGSYETHVDKIELFNARTTGTPGIKLVFRVCDGQHAGRLIFHDLWLTEAALPRTKRDLAKLGITQKEQLDSATLPSGRIRCLVRVAQRVADDGFVFNHVRTFEVIRIDDPPTDPFAPVDGTSGGPGSGSEESAAQISDADVEASSDPAQPAATCAEPSLVESPPTNHPDGSLFVNDVRPTGWAEQ